MINLFVTAALTVLVLGVLLNFPQLMVSLWSRWQKNKLFLIAWLIMFVGIALFVKHSSSITSISSMDPSSRNQALFMTFGGIMTFIMMLLSRPFKHLFCLPLICLILYAVIGIMSSFCSSTPLLSAYKATLLVIDALLAASALKYFEKQLEGEVKLLELTYALLVAVIISSFLGTIIWPQEALVRTSGPVGVILYGTLPHVNPNELGFLGAVLSGVSCNRLLIKSTTMNTIQWLCLLFGGLAVVFLTQSRTSIIGLLLAGTLIVWGRPRLRWLGFFSVILLGACLAFYASVSDVGKIESVGSSIEYLQRGQEKGGLRTIKGRLSAWRNIGWEMFLDRPFVGHGFDTGVRYGGIKYGIAKTHMHNSFFQVLANSGLLGLIPWLLFIFTVSWCTFKDLFRYHWPVRTYADKIHVEVAAVLLIILTRSLTGSVLVNHSWSLMLFLSIYVFYIVSLHQRRMQLNAPESS